MLPSCAQKALIEAKEGDVIELGEGKLRIPLHLVARRKRRDDSRPGARQDHPQLRGTRAGDRRRGLLITSKHDVTLENFAVEDTRGDGIKANGTKKITVPQDPHRVDRAAPRKPTAVMESTPSSAAAC